MVEGKWKKVSQKRKKKCLKKTAKGRTWEIKGIGKEKGGDQSLKERRKERWKERREETQQKQREGNEIIGQKIQKMIVINLHIAEFKYKTSLKILKIKSINFYFGKH